VASFSNESFALSSGDSASGAGFEKLNGKLIAASRAGGYRYVDGAARPSTGYVYRLQTVGLDGSVRWAGRLSISRDLTVRSG